MKTEERKRRVVLRLKAGELLPLLGSTQQCEEFAVCHLGSERCVGPGHSAAAFILLLLVMILPCIEPERDLLKLGLLLFAVCVKVVTA